MNLPKAIHLLGAHTGGRFDVWMLAGSARASARAWILSELTGRKVPQSQAGVNALRSALYAAAGVTGDCEAHRESTFLAWAQGSGYYRPGQIVQ
jgi:hypothetical protein